MRFCTKLGCTPLHRPTRCLIGRSRSFAMPSSSSSAQPSKLTRMLRAFRRTGCSTSAGGSDPTAPGSPCRMAACWPSARWGGAQLLLSLQGSTWARRPRRILLARPPRRPSDAAPPAARRRAPQSAGCPRPRRGSGRRRRPERRRSRRSRCRCGSGRRARRWTWPEARNCHTGRLKQLKSNSLHGFPTSANLCCPRPPRLGPDLQDVLRVVAAAFAPGTAAPAAARRHAVYWATRRQQHCLQ
mmetsp:Transcript_72296/g.234760  ORF Transcript_72296/g.234760 Transcript_72296/m.234760 type:complete len:242 (-) Transcript_72296:1749-2474(-)